VKKTAYGTPLFINSSKQVIPLKRKENLSELEIQTLILENPELLPISEIDESYNPVLPVCTELRTNAGPLDILLVTPNGELTIVETKLWRNPEARRVVIAQILDYAKELSKWSYEDLQREVNLRLKKKGNTLYEIAKSADSHLLPPESDFVDSVSRNLRRGKFLLVIAGDGIREGAIGITEFLSDVGNLNFTFAMVELSVYAADNVGVLVQPKTIVRTIDIPKMTIELPAGLVLKSSDTLNESGTTNQRLSPDRENERNFYENFWQEFLTVMSFDDPGQPMPNPGRAQNLFVYPAKTRKVWISAYFAKSSNEVGVYFKTQNDPDGHLIANSLAESKDIIRTELGNAVSWWNWDDVISVGIKLSCEDPLAVKNRESIIEFFSINLNKYVNAFRPRLRSLGI
jgi:hypothetical protein